jgi:hypothetical protein
MVANWTEKRGLEGTRHQPRCEAGSGTHSSPAPKGLPSSPAGERGAHPCTPAGTADANGLARHSPLRSSGRPLPLASRRRAAREAVLRCAVRWNDLLVRASPANSVLRHLAAGCLRPAQGALGGRLRRIGGGRRIGAIGRGGISFTRAFCLSGRDVWSVLHDCSDPLCRVGHALCRTGDEVLGHQSPLARGSTLMGVSAFRRRAAMPSVPRCVTVLLGELGCKLFV